ncbi:MAG TPA: DNA ligase D [Roseiarcus sp.]|jgi:bifunctional non-homologous end joining protein LigD|nr:DNA ligase D [Roseiarcus sp.]
MALEQYRAKRNFEVTPEPRSTAPSASEGHSFVVQKHDARRLHYDFRLELDGVLKSWAVTRGPSLVPGEKRLAVAVEDHPLEYGSFEGTIPKGEYGGGAVLVWDRGAWAPIGDPHTGLAKGHLEFELSGQKLQGRWHLVRMKGKPREKHENWLLIKGDDEFARDKEAPDILEEQPKSAASGRPIAEVAKEAPGWSSKTGRIERRGEAAEPPDPAGVKGARKGPMPPFVEPMQATAVKAPLSGDRWLHEVKYDGYRIEARIDRAEIKLLTRAGLDWTTKFGEPILEALRALPASQALIDGEVVAENEAGASDFSALQAALSEEQADRLTFYAFDLLYLDGFDLRDASLIARKRLLEALIGGGSGAVRYSGHFEEDGAIVFRHACRLGLEGIVSKLRDSPYRPGRGRSWAKIKCSGRQEFVIAGFVPSTAQRNAIGSLVLGVYEDGKLRHVGRVGTGFTATVARALYARLEPMRVASSPFARRLGAAEARQVRYVRPELVAEVDFRGWTADKILRHASFKALREDKPAREVTRESEPSNSPKAKESAVELTHPDRLYWPDDGVTKQGLADYYAEVWPHMAPFVVDRALALVRCPDGITGEKFFQKHAWKGIGSAIARVQDPMEKGEPLISVRDLDGLIALVQMAVLEIHPWGSTVTNWERPDTIIMDLDPGEGVPWEAVIEAAREVRDRLGEAGLTAFVKTSGGKGLHVVAPVKPKADWPAVKAFTKGMADAMVADSPSRYVATIAKVKRTGKILIDYLRNQRGTTAIAAYSTRARPGAAVSMPLDWDELGPEIGPARFTVLNAPARLATLDRDPWEGFRAAEAPIEEGTRPRRAGQASRRTDSTAASGRQASDRKRARGAKR